jgi:predicted alpha-1,6-mannanase (GH76 family)
MMMKRTRRRLTLAATLVLIATSAASNAQTADNTSSSAQPYLHQAAKGVTQMQSWYSTSSGLYQTTGWWNSGNAITVLTNYMKVSGSKQYVPALANTLTAAQTTYKGFLNNYYDDEGWWALAWIDAYDLTKNPQFLAMAQSIFTDMSGGWDMTTCGGGIWWSKDKTYKNAIANELFLSVASELASRAQDPQARAQYLKWATQEWSWFKASGMINAENLVNDGLNSSNPAACTNNGQTTWSYNQGVILGGLTELGALTHDASLVTEAKLIATAAITHLTDAAGILHDPCEPNCGGDGPQFKGIFVRNLMPLYAAAPDPAYKTFVDNNASSIWSKDQGTNTSFGLIWSGPFDSADAARQSSALDALVAAATMEHGTR